MYTYVFYLLLVILKMAYEEIGTRHGKKCYHMPHMRLLDDDRKKIRFTNYGKCDRRKAHKKFVDASYLRHKIDDEEDMKNIENDVVTSRFMMMMQSSYGQMIDEAMKTFVTREQELSSVEIRGKMTLNLKSKIFAKNLNLFALFFKGLYKFANRNPKGKAFSKYLLNKYLHLPDEKKIREKVEMEKRKLLSQGNSKKKSDDDDHDELDDNDDRIYGDEKNKIIPAFKTN